MKCVSVISRIHWALGCVYILLALLFLYCALLAHVRCKRLTNILLNYIALQSIYMEPFVSVLFLLL